LKRVLFGDLFEKFCLMENENAELKLRIKILELQISTLKKKNEEMLSKKDANFLNLKKNIVELLKEGFVVNNRLNIVLDLLKNL
jgi:hypothetical protein